MSDEAVVRTARATEIGAVRALLVETWHDTYDASIGVDKVREITDRWHAEDVLSRQLNLEGACFLVAVIGDTEIVGHAFAAHDEAGGVTLSRLYVKPTAQGRRLGARLLAEVFRRFATASNMRLEVEVENHKARAFYQAHGFRDIGRVDQCGGDSGMAAIVMEKVLDSRTDPD